MHRAWMLLVFGFGTVSAAEPDTAADEAVLRDEGGATDGPGLLEFFRRRVAKVEGEKIEALIKQLTSRKFREREEAKNALIQIGEPARPFLVKQLRNDDIEFLRRVELCLTTLDRMSSPELEGAAVRVLRARRPVGTTAALLAVLPTVRDAGVEEEIQAALLDLGVKNGKADEELIKALRDREPSRRCAAAVVVGRSGSAPQRDHVRKLLRGDPETRVRLRAAQGLIAGKDVKAVAALPPLLTDAPLDLAEEAHDLLLAIAGEKGPTRSLSANRRKCRETWEAWLKANEMQAVLGRPELDLPWLNVNDRILKAATEHLAYFHNGVPEPRTKSALPYKFLGFIIEGRGEAPGGMTLAGLRRGGAREFDAREFRLIDVPKFIASTKCPETRAFLKRVPLSELRIARYGDSGAVVYVRVRGGQLRVIGIDSPR